MIIIFQYTLDLEGLSFIFRKKKEQKNQAQNKLKYDILL